MASLNNQNVGLFGGLFNADIYNSFLFDLIERTAVRKN